MSARVPPGFFELWIQFNTETDPEPMFSAFGLRFDGEPTLSPEAAAINVLSAATSALSSCITSLYTLGPGYVMVGQDGDEDVRVDATETFTGGSNTDPLTDNCAWLVKKQTLVGGKRGRGRMFWPGVSRALTLPSGQLTEPGFELLQGAIADMVDAIVAVDGDPVMCLFHQTAPFDPTDIKNLAADHKVATQRHRMRP